MAGDISAKAAFRELRREGPRLLYRGCSPPMVQKAMSYGTMFATYREVSTAIMKTWPELPCSVAKAGGGILAGLMEGCLYTSFERIQTLLQVSTF
jgi:hypothetical protein